MTYEVFQGDSFPSIRANITLNSQPFDLSDASAIVFTWRQGEVVKSLSGIVTDVANGLVEFELQSDSFDTPGRFTYDIEVTFNDGKKGTFKRSLLTVHPDTP